jgi:hypothetical protein
MLSCAKQLGRYSVAAGIALLLALSGGQVAAAEEQPAAASDLRYGVSLYHYFQKDYLAALSELQVADLRGGIEDYGNAPLVLRGEMSLAFGLDRSASQIFEQALDQESSELVRNAAWFYLSKMRFRRGDWQGATASLLRIEGKLDPRLLDEFNAMQVNVALRSGDLATAVSAMDDLDRKNPWQPYLYYNLGTAHIRADKNAEGIEYLDRLAAMKRSSAEYRAIRDKALTAAGFSLMQQQQYTDAMARFSQVKLDSPFVEQALLGYGWSAVELGDYHRALAPWQVLAGRSPLRPAVQEALLAVPYAYEKLGSLGSALSEFEAAEAVFSAEIDRLDALKLSLSPRHLLETVRFNNTEPELAQSELDSELVGLIELLSGDQFQLYSRDMRDLDAMGQRLDYWRRNIDIYRDMLVHRALAREQKLARMSASDYSGKLQAIVEQRMALAGQLAEASIDTDMPAIADAENKARWGRVDAAQQALQRLDTAGDNVATQQQELERYRGLFLWDWQRQASKRLRALDQAIADAQGNLLSLQQVADEVPDIAPFERRLQQLQQRLQLQTVALDQSLRATEAGFYQVVVAELEQQQNRLRYYQSQARLARARLYDRAQQEASR